MCRRIASPWALQVCFPLPPIISMKATDILYPYQRRWMEDDTLLKIGLWARQTGKDFTCAAEAVVDMAMRPKSTWVVFAASERQALESLAKARDWATACELFVEAESLERSWPGAVMKMASVEWHNGSRMMALPSRPSTVRGFSANIILTEFAFHDDPEAVWKALYPMISNPLRGGVKKLRIVSTPNGRGNFFHELWRSEQFAKHSVTIHEAVAQGLPIDIADLQAGLGDAEAWAQEYECAFIDNARTLLTYETILACEHERAKVLSGSLPLRGERVMVGIDFGRKQDRTVCWTLVERESIWWTHEVLVLENTDTPEQLRLLRSRVNLARRVCLDSTGVGLGLGELLVREFTEWNGDPGAPGRVALCHFTSALKANIFGRLRPMLETQAVRLPIDIGIREDLHALQRVLRPGGGISYEAPRGPEGHSDRSTALALALHAVALDGSGLRPAAPAIASVERNLRSHREANVRESSARRGR